LDTPYDDDIASDSPAIASLSFKPSKGSSIILEHNFGDLYPIPSSLKSPQISIYQSGLASLATSIFHKESDFVSWFDDFLAQALLVNMHEYFAGQIIFQLHPLCDAQFYLRQATVANPFQLKNVTDNIEYLEFTSPSNILHPSQLDFYSDNPTIVYVTKTQCCILLN
jgi:hypothetical protein